MDYCTLTHCKRAISNFYFVHWGPLVSLCSGTSPICLLFSSIFFGHRVLGPLSKPGLFVCLVVFSGHLVVPKKVRKALVHRITSLFFCIFVCLVNCFPPEKVCKPWGKLGVSCICLFVYINCVPPFLFALFVCPWISCVSCDFFRLHIRLFA